MRCSKPAPCLLHPGFKGAQLVLQFAVLLTYLVEVLAQLLQLLVGLVACAQRVSGEAHRTLRPGFEFMIGNAFKHTDGALFPEIASDIVDDAILSTRGQPTQDAALHKVHPRRTIHQRQESINTPGSARFAQGFGSSRFHQVAHIAILEQRTESLRGTIRQLCLLRRLELSKGPCDGSTGARELHWIKVLECL